MACSLDECGWMDHTVLASLLLLRVVFAKCMVVVCEPDLGNCLEPISSQEISKVPIGYVVLIN